MTVSRWPKRILPYALTVSTSSGYNIAPVIDYNNSHMGWISPTQNPITRQTSVLSRRIDACGSHRHHNVDVSTPQSRAAMILSFVPYFFLFAAIIGAFYLTIDTTTGERERGSLEPLFTTAISHDT